MRNSYSLPRLHRGSTPNQDVHQRLDGCPGDGMPALPTELLGCLIQAGPEVVRAADHLHEA